MPPLSDLKWLKPDVRVRISLKKNSSSLKVFNQQFRRELLHTSVGIYKDEVQIMEYLNNPSIHVYIDTKWIKDNPKRRYTMMMTAQTTTLTS